MENLVEVTPVVEPELEQEEAALVETVEVTPVVDAAEQLAQKELELFKREVAHELKVNDLSQFESVVMVSNHEELKEVVASLRGIVDGIISDTKLSVSYVPKEHAKQDEYSQAVQEKDVGKMLSNKFSKFFK